MTTFFRQALWNLLFDALHALTSGGVLEISTRVPATGECCIEVASEPGKGLSFTMVLTPG